jgi:hypothetical protein
MAGAPLPVAGGNVSAASERLHPDTTSGKQLRVAIRSIRFIGYRLLAGIE